MAGPFNARIFAYRGVVQIEQRHPKQYTADTVFLLDDPYEWSGLLLVPAGGGAISSVVQPAPDLSTVLYIQIPDGQQVRYEVNPRGPTGSGARVAGNLSPRLSGFAQIPWGAGFSISMCDASAFL